MHHLKVQNTVENMNVRLFNIWLSFLQHTPRPTEFTAPIATVNLPTSTSTDMGCDPSFSNHVHLDSRFP